MTHYDRTVTTVSCALNALCCAITGHPLSLLRPRSEKKKGGNHKVNQLLTLLSLEEWEQVEREQLRRGGCYNSILAYFIILFESRPPGLRRRRY